MRTSLLCLNVVAAAGLLFALAGCSGSDDAPSNASGSLAAGSAGSEPQEGLAAKLVGRWEGAAEWTAGEGDPNVTVIEADPVPVSFDFRQDRTLNVSLLFPMSGTWEPLRSEGNTLTVKTVLEMPSFSFEQSTDQAEGGEPTTIEHSEMSTEKETDEWTIVFETDDRIVVTSKDDPQPLKLERNPGS